LDPSRSTEVTVPHNNVDQIFLRYTDSHVREMRMMQGANTILKTTTAHKDGQQLFTRVNPKHEIVGYFGYLDDREMVTAIGLIISTHS
jgi:hypothetical protein